MNEKNYKPSLFVLTVFFAMLLNGCTRVLEREQVQLYGSPMEPNYFDGDMFYVYPVTPEALERGDLVTFVTQGYRYLRRIVGLPNESVEIRDGEVLIDGIPLDEPYRVYPASYRVELIQLSNDEYYVLCDNRDVCEDSHTFGPIQFRQILGLAISEKAYASR